MELIKEVCMERHGAAPDTDMADPPLSLNHESRQPPTPQPPVSGLNGSVLRVLRVERILKIPLHFHE